MKSRYPDVNIRLIEGGGGIFDIKCNGKLIYSKQHTAEKRFPNDGEITGLIERERAGGRS